MNLSDLSMILAVLFSPFLAVFAQGKIDLCREKHGQRLWIFRTLMATRAHKVSLEHVQALNSIDLVFNDSKKDKNIVEQWNEYLDHFSQGPQEGDKDYPTKLASWLERGDDLLANLLRTMGKSLGYDFDKVKIKRGIYFPRAHGEEMSDQFIIRKGLAKILDGKASLSVEVKNAQA